MRAARTAGIGVHVLLRVSRASAHRHATRARHREEGDERAHFFKGVSLRVKRRLVKRQIVHHGHVPIDTIDIDIR